MNVYNAVADLRLKPLIVMLMNFLQRISQIMRHDDSRF